MGYMRGYKGEGSRVSLRLVSQMPIRFVSISIFYEQIYGRYGRKKTYPALSTRFNLLRCADACAHFRLGRAVVDIQGCEGGCSGEGEEGEESDGDERLHFELLSWSCVRKVGSYRENI